MRLTSRLSSLLLPSTFLSELVVGIKTEFFASVLEDGDGVSDIVEPPSVDRLAADATLTAVGFCVASAAVNSAAAVSC